MLASAERRRVAARIANISRHRPGDPELPELRRRLDVLRVADIAAWAAAASVELPGTAEVATAALVAVRAGRVRNQAGDTAA